MSKLYNLKKWFSWNIDFYKILGLAMLSQAVVFSFWAHATLSNPAFTNTPLILFIGMCLASTATIDWILAIVLLGGFYE